MSISEINRGSTPEEAANWSPEGFKPHATPRQPAVPTPPAAPRPFMAEPRGVPQAPDFAAPRAEWDPNVHPGGARPRQAAQPQPFTAEARGLPGQPSTPAAPRQAETSVTEEPTSTEENTRSQGAFSAWRERLFGKQGTTSSKGQETPLTESYKPTEDPGQYETIDS